MEDNQNIAEKSLFDFYSKREATENFSLDELLNFAKQRNLQEWLAENFYASEARKLAAALKNDSSDAELKLLICKIFDLPIENLSEQELQEISSVVEKNHRRELYMKKIPGDDRKYAFAETQGELVKALRDEAQVIYLCGGEFRIPLHKRGITYIGCENAVVDLDSEEDVNLDELEIILEDLQVFIHNPITLHDDKSKNIKILDGSKKVLGERPTLKEILDILRGRKTFESPEEFKNRAENLRMAAVGKVLLEEKDYNFDTAQFKIQPHWDFEYISVLKDFAADKNFFATIRHNDAEALYGNERKLQIFADFTYIGGKLTILNLYFATKTLGKIIIETFLRGKNFSAENSEENSAEDFIGSSCMFGLGYGLDIIADYENWDGWA